MPKYDGETIRRDLIIICSCPGSNIVRSVSELWTGQFLRHHDMANNGHKLQQTKPTKLFLQYQANNKVTFVTNLADTEHSSTTKKCNIFQRDLFI